MRSKVKIVRYVLETVKYRTPLLWANAPEKCKTVTSPNGFKTKIKTCKSETCVCRCAWRAFGARKTSYFG